MSTVAAISFAQTGTVEGTLTVKKGGALTSAKNTLVFIKGYQSAPPKAPAQMFQSGRSFSPVVLPVIRRQWVHFINDEADGIFHHVFSPQNGDNAFDTGWFKAGTKRQKQFVTEGRVDVFCDIHRMMIATVYVVPNSQFVVLDTADGPTAKFRLENVQAGDVTVVAWHRSTDKPTETPIKVTSGGVTQVELVIDSLTGFEALLQKHARRMGQPYAHDERKKEKDPW